MVWWRVKACQVLQDDDAEDVDVDDTDVDDGEDFQLWKAAVDTD